jgi:RNA polymerase sigma factor (sigma-70 family)
MSRTQSPVVPFFSNPLLHRFLQSADNRRLFTNVVLTRNEADRLELERRFAEHYFEMRFLGFVRKHIHYEALHLLNKSRAKAQQEPLLLNMPLSAEESGGHERIELLEDPHTSVETQVMEESEELLNLTGNPALHEAIQGLTHKQQTVLYLLYVKQRTEAEISVELGVSQQAINKLKQSSLSLLRKKMGQGPAERSVGR